MPCLAFTGDITVCSSPITQTRAHTHKHTAAGRPCFHPYPLLLFFFFPPSWCDLSLYCPSFHFVSTEPSLPWFVLCSPPMHLKLSPSVIKREHLERLRRLVHTHAHTTRQQGRYLRCQLLVVGYKNGSVSKSDRDLKTAAALYRPSRINHGARCHQTRVTGHMCTLAQVETGGGVSADAVGVCLIACLFFSFFPQKYESERLALSKKCLLWAVKLKWSFCFWMSYSLTILPLHFV